jgi:hypothetical protein
MAHDPRDWEISAAETLSRVLEAIARAEDAVARAEDAVACSRDVQDIVRSRLATLEFLRRSIREAIGIPWRP